MKLIVTDSWYDTLKKNFRNSKYFYIYDNTANLVQNIQNKNIFKPENSFFLNLTEKKKNLNQLQKTYEELDKFNIGKDTIIVCLGNFLLIDLVSVFAASYLGGLSLVLIPVDFFTMTCDLNNGKLNLDYKKNIFQINSKPTIVLFDQNYLLSDKNKNLVLGLFKLISFASTNSLSLFKNIEKKWTDIFLHKEKNIKDFIIPMKQKVIENIKKPFLGNIICNAIECSSKYKIENGIALAFAMEIELEAATIAGFLNKNETDRVFNLLNGIYNYFKHIGNYREQIMEISFPLLISYLSVFLHENKGIPCSLSKKLGLSSTKEQYISLEILEAAYKKFIGKVKNDISTSK